MKIVAPKQLGPQTITWLPPFNLTVPEGHRLDGSVRQNWMFKQFSMSQKEILRRHYVCAKTSVFLVNRNRHTLSCVDLEATTAIC